MSEPKLIKAERRQTLLKKAVSQVDDQQNTLEPLYEAKGGISERTSENANTGRSKQLKESDSVGNGLSSMLNKLTFGIFGPSDPENS